MRKWQPILIVALVLGRLVGGALAQSPDTDDFKLEAEPVEHAKKKEPSFWHRPAKATPEEQLVYADALLAQGAARKARKHYLALVHRWHESPEAVTAQIALAMLFEQAGKYERAFEEFQYLIERYPGRFPYDVVLSHQFAVANQVLYAKRGGFLFFRGFAAPEDALPLLEQFVRNAPNAAQAPEAQFRVGWVHEQSRDWEEAAAAYETLGNRYPGHPLAETAAYRRAYALFRLSEQRPRDEVECRKALSALAICLSRHPEATEVAEARAQIEALKARLASMYFERAAFYEKTGKARAAVIAYTDFIKNFPSSDLARTAGERIQALGGQEESQHAKP